jgi:hypothetical protein
MPVDVKALVFDVFGTVVDWRSSMICEGEQLGRVKGVKADWAKHFNRAWHRLSPGESIMIGALLFSSMVVAAAPVTAPVTVAINGNFGPPSGTTLLDNLNYSMTYTVPDPHTPDNSFGNLDPAFASAAIYDVSAALSIPTLNFSVVKPIRVEYFSQQPFGQWLSVTMTGLGFPVGDFFIWLFPVRTLNGQPLWNGLAGPLGNPELELLTAAPARAPFWALQSIPGDGSGPIAFYENGSASISQTTSTPEPATFIPLVVFSLVLGSTAARRRQLVKHQ